MNILVLKTNLFVSHYHSKKIDSDNILILHLYLMSIINILNDINLKTKTQTLKLKKTKQNIIIMKLIAFSQSTCVYCNDHKLTSYILVANKQKINEQIISFTCIIHIDEDGVIHNLTLKSLSSNVAKIDKSRQLISYQTSALFNMFMKQYYDKQEYIRQDNCHSQDYECIMQKDKLISYEYGQRNIIHIHDKRLFKNIIVIIACVVRNIQKNMVA